MRIAISGSQGIGKTTVVNDFLANWPNYRVSNGSYRKAIKEKNIPLNKNVTQAGQWEILQCLLSDIEGLRSSDCVIFDRCALDNIVYSLWALGTTSGDITPEFIEKCAPLIREYMKKIDIIFFIPITSVAPVVYEKKEGRDIDPLYAKEIDNIFKAISQLHNENKCPFFEKGDAPPIIEIMGSPRERIEIIKLYVNSTGTSVVEGESVLSSLSDIQLMEGLIHEQLDAKEIEQKQKTGPSIIKSASKPSR